MKLLITGTSKHKGNFQDESSGRDISFDFSRIYTIAPMQQGDDKKGSAGVDMRCEPAIFDMLRNENFKEPVLCEVETDLRAMGSGKAKETVVKVTPIK